MSILNYLLEHLINEISAEEKYEKNYKGMDKDLFNTAIEVDPTSSKERAGKYLDWIIKQKLYDKGEELSQLLPVYDKFISKIPPKFKPLINVSFDDFISMMNDEKEKGTFLSKKDRKNDKTSQAYKETDKILETDKYLVVQPKTMLASQYWTAKGGGNGKGCSWCTGAKNNETCHFDRYAKIGDIFIIISKNDKNDKYQIAIPHDGEELPNANYDGNNGEYEYRDCNNERFDPWETFSNDPKVIAWMNDSEFPEYGEPEQDLETLGHDFYNSVSSALYNIGLGDGDEDFTEKVVDYYMEDVYADGDTSFIDSDQIELLKSFYNKLIKIGIDNPYIDYIKDEELYDDFFKNGDIGESDIRTFIEDHADLIEDGGTNIFDYEILKANGIVKDIDDYLYYVSNVINTKDDVSEYNLGEIQDVINIITDDNYHKLYIISDWFDSLNYDEFIEYMNDLNGISEKEQYLLTMMLYDDDAEDIIEYFKDEGLDDDDINKLNSKLKDIKVNQYREEHNSADKKNINDALNSFRTLFQSDLKFKGNRQLNDVTFFMNIFDSSEKFGEFLKFLEKWYEKYIETTPSSIDDMLKMFKNFRPTEDQLDTLKELLTDVENVHYHKMSDVQQKLKLDHLMYYINNYIK